MILALPRACKRELVQTLDELEFGKYSVNSFPLFRG
jgi:hypothetical protein